MTTQISHSPSIAIIGAGFGGIGAAIQVEKQLGLKSFTIFDENETFGGTWLVNAYPGCACDVPSHLYSFSFELNPDWTQNYASRDEILAYLTKVAKKYELDRRTRFLTQVKSMEWQEARGQWELTIFDKMTNLKTVLHFDFMISAVGGLRVPFWPEEFKNFAGPIIHSAQWPTGDPTALVNLFENKRVAIIGSGASAIQIIPNIFKIAPKVQEVHSYQRRPAWVEPRVQFEFSKIFKKLFTIFPLLMCLFRGFCFILHEIHFTAFQENTIFNRLETWLFEIFLRRQIPGEDKEDLRKQLTPNYKLGCRRILISENYFQTFNRPQMHLHREAIEKVEGQKIFTTDGQSTEVDVLILATGFRVQDYFSPMKVTASGQIDLLHFMRSQGPISYYGICTNIVPNGFCILGPNTALGHNSIVFMQECQVNFALQIIKETLRRRAKTVRVSQSAENAWMTRTLADIKRNIWGTHSCGGWFADARGIVTTLWPKNCTSYFRETRRVDFSLFEFTFDTSKF